MTELASRGQVNKLQRLFAEAGVELPSKRLKSFRSMTKDDASKAIGKAETDLVSAFLTTYVAAQGLATTSQLLYLAGLRKRLRKPITLAQLAVLNELTTVEAHRVTSITSKAVQDRNDALGLPIPKWRAKFPLQDAGALSANQLAKLAKLRMAGLGAVASGIGEPHETPAPLPQTVPRRKRACKTSKPIATDYERRTGRDL